MLVPVSKHTILFSFSLPLSLSLRSESLPSQLLPMIFKISRKARIHDAQLLTLFRGTALFSCAATAINITNTIPCLLRRPSPSICPSETYRLLLCATRTHAPGWRSVKKKGGGWGGERVKKRAERHPSYKTLSTCRGVFFFLLFFSPSRKNKLKLSVSGDRAARLFHAKDLKRPPLSLRLQYFSAPRYGDAFDWWIAGYHRRGVSYIWADVSHLDSLKSCTTSRDSPAAGY